MNNKISTILFIIIAIAALWFVRHQYSDYNLNKTISACIVAQKQTKENFSISDEEKNELSYAVNTHFGFAPYAPIFFISAKENTGIDDILDTVLIIHEERMRRIEPSMLSNLIWDIVGSHQIQHKGKRSLVIRSVIQDNINPPTFKFKVNDTNLIHFSYKRYIENQMRKELDFQWTHLNLIFY